MNGCVMRTILDTSNIDKIQGKGRLVINFIHNEMDGSIF